MNSIEPTSHYYTVAGLRLHYLHWGDHQQPPLLLVHGGRDHAHMWDAIAKGLAPDYSIYVPDLRGHGDSDWAPASQYAIPEFVTDLAALVNHIAAERHREERFNLVGHSRGAGIVLRYAGTFPERVERVAAVDGLGRHTRWQIPAPERLRAWVDHRLEADTWKPRVYASLEAAADRVMQNNPRISRDLALDLARFGTRAVDGGYTWKFDPRAHYHPAYDFDDAELRRFFAAITARVLLVRGDQSHLGEKNQQEWVPAFADARSVIIEGAGHWLQHDCPDELLRLLQEFLAAPATAQPNAVA